MPVVTLSVTSRRREEMTDITRQVADAVRENGWQEGFLAVFTPHTTAAITINENADPDVPRDMTTFLNSLIPQQANFRHAEGNSDAHLKSSLVGASEVVIVQNGSLLLGTWQGLWFCEFDGPQRRQVHLSFVGK